MILVFRKPVKEDPESVWIKTLEEALEKARKKDEEMFNTSFILPEGFTVSAKHQSPTTERMVDRMVKEMNTPKETELTELERAKIQLQHAKQKVVDHFNTDECVPDGLIKWHNRLVEEVRNLEKEEKVKPKSFKERVIDVINDRMKINEGNKAVERELKFIYGTILSWQD